MTDELNISVEFVGGGPLDGLVKRMPFGGGPHVVNLEGYVYKYAEYFTEDFPSTSFRSVMKLIATPKQYKP